MSKALNYLIENKKEELKSSWLKNTFVRYKISNTKNSLSEAILRSTQRGEYKRTFNELQSFYEGVVENLEKPSNIIPKQIYLKIFQDPNLKEYIKKNDIIIKKTDSLRNITFYYDQYPDYVFYFFPPEIRNLPDNCNLIKYLSGIDIKLPYNYFKIRFREKLTYINIVENVKKLKEENKRNICDETKTDIREKNMLNKYLSFSKNLFSSSVKKDYKFYLFLYPKIFKINFIIFTPFDNDVVVQNIIEEDENYPYLILFKPLKSEDNEFMIELGSIIINRKSSFLLSYKTDAVILEKIKDRYNNKENNNPIIEYLKLLKENKYIDYLKNYNFDKDNEIEELIRTVKYYNYDFNP